MKYGRSADNFVRPVAQFSLLLTPTFVVTFTLKSAIFKNYILVSFKVFSLPFSYLKIKIRDLILGLKDFKK